MKWSAWIVFSLVALGAMAANGAEPSRLPPRLTRVPVIPARYAAEDQKAEDQKPAPAANVTPHTPVHYKLATWDIWSGTSTGYVYAPGACDYTPPCVNHLWDGYVQMPHRCYPPTHGGRHGCGHGGCGSCGSCNSCGLGSSCGCGHPSMLRRAHGWHFGSKVGCSSCGVIAPSCGQPTCAAPTCAAPSCGFDGKDYDMGPAPAPAPDAPPAPMPDAGGEEPKAEAATSDPTPEMTRGRRLRGFTWPESSLQR